MFQKRFKRHPNLFTSFDLYNLTDALTEIEGRLVPSRPISHTSFFKRIKYAIMVFCGKADILVWFKQ